MPPFRSARTRRSRSRTSSPRCASCSTLDGTEHVLDVGTGSGYAAAVLDELAASVVSVERIDVLAERARRALAATGHGDVEVRVADGSLGAPDRAPFDAIAVAAATPAIPRRSTSSSRSAGAWCSRSAAPAASGSCASSATPERARVETASLGCRFVPLVDGLRQRAPSRRRPLPSPGGWTSRTVHDGRGGPRGRMDAALRRRANWEQLVKFCVVGATGYVVNLVVYTLLLRGRGLPLPARRDRLVPRRRHEQLPLEPRLDVPAPARPRRAPGAALLRRLDARARREPARPAPARRSAGPRRGRRAGDRDHPRDAGQLRRQQAVVVPPPALTACWPRRRVSSARRRRPGDGRHRGGGDRPRPARARPDSAARRCPPAEPRLDEDAAVEAFLAHPKVERWLERYPPGPTTDASFDADDGTWTVHVWSGEAGEVARGRRRRRRRPGDRGVDRPAGRLADGARATRRVRREAPHLLAGVARALRGLPPRARRPAPPALAANARPAGAALVRRLARVLQPRRGLPQRVARGAAARLPRSRARPGSASAGKLAAEGRTLPRWPVWLLAAATLFLVGFRVGLNVEQPRTVIDVGYAGRDRRRPHPRRAGAVRRDAGRRRPGVRAAPVGRPRFGSGSRPTGAASRRTRAATRTARSRTSPTSRRCWRSGGRAAGTTLPAAHATAIGARPPRARSGSCSSGAGSAARGSPSHPRLRLGRVPVHGVRPAGEHERRDHAGAPRLGLLARVVTRGARRRRRARGLDEVRGAARRAALAHVPLGPATGVGRAIRRRRSASRRCRVLGPPPRAVAPRRARDVLGPDDRIPARPRVAVLDLGLGAVPRRRASPTSARCRPSCRSVTIVLAGVAAALPREKGPLELAALTAAVLLARRALADALVLPLPSLGAPVRAARAAAPRAPAPRTRRSGTPADRPRRALLAAGVFVARRRRGDRRLGARSATRSRTSPLYRTYGERVADGLVPYRDFPFEYPPGALPALVLPALVTDSLEAYRAVFVAELAAIGAARGARARLGAPSHAARAAATTPVVARRRRRRRPCSSAA